MKFLDTSGLYASYTSPPDLEQCKRDLEEVLGEDAAYDNPIAVALIYQARMSNFIEYRKLDVFISDLRVIAEEIINQKISDFGGAA